MSLCNLNLWIADSARQLVVFLVRIIEDSLCRSQNSIVRTPHIPCSLPPVPPLVRPPPQLRILLAIRQT